MTSYLLKHPVVGIVLNAMILLVGILCFDLLSVREYPHIHFPAIQVTTHYPNASAESVESSITNPLEEQLAGIENISSLTSESKHGSSSITLTFKNGTNLQVSMNSVRDAISLATLPREVKTPVVERKTPTIGPPFMVISLESSSMAFGELTHYANLNLKNVFRGIKGVASVEIWGQPFTYSITLDPSKMHTFGVNVEDVYNALKSVNRSLPVGKFQDEVPTTLEIEFNTPEDFESLVVKDKNYLNPQEKQEPVFLRQIADVHLTTDQSQFRIRTNGTPGLCISIKRAADANPLDVSSLVKAELKKVQETLPSHMRLKVILDQAEFIRYSIDNVSWSLAEAIFCVLIIVFLFLRNIKSTIIPLVTIPISLMGSFIFLKLMGFSINIITLLGMVLAIGLVVDDAIVMLENIQRYIDGGSTPLEGALKGSKEIGFAIVGMTLTLTCVYMPLFFITGPLGDVFIEFGVSLAGSVLISGVVALTLSPFMCSQALRKQPTVLWPQIDIFFERLTRKYHSWLTWFITKFTVALILLLSSFALVYFFLTHLPQQIAPKEDRNLIGIYIPPIPGKNINYMEQKALIIENIIKGTPEAQNQLVFLGDWGGSIVLTLKPKSQRKRSAQQIVSDLSPAVAQVPSLEAYPWSWDSGLPGMDDAGTSGDLSLIISTTKSYPALFETLESIKKSLTEEKKYLNIRHDLKLDTPSYKITLNPDLMANLSLSAAQIAKTIEVFFSKDQTLTFSKEGVIYPITLESKSAPWGLDELYVSNREGERISLGVVAQLISTSRPDKLFHYNQMRSTTLTADLPPEKSQESGMNEFHKAVNAHLSSDFKTSWSQGSKTFKDAQNSVFVLFILAIIFIYAVLAVLFESFIDPLIILIMAPFACLGGLLLLWGFQEPITIYTQIGLITLIGLISKHGILMVEFANTLSKKLSWKEAISQAALLRLRPILMTTGAMIVGTLPLVLGNRAGQEAQQAIGLVLIGGLLIGTLLTLFVLPPFYVAVKSFIQTKKTV